MEPARDAPWAEHEKLYLLAEILKAAPIPTSMLYGIIRDAQIQPRWNDIALPHGRSLRSCQNAFNDLAAANPGADYRQRAPLPAPPLTYTGPEIPKKRPLQPETSTPIGRLLQPRPPQSYPGEYTGGPTYVMSPVGEPANKKKRGRPTKAEAQARADAAAARGEIYPPPRKQRTSLPSVEPAPLPPGRATPGPVPMASMVATTPQVPHMEIEETSSGKRRRTKPSPLELERLPGGEAAFERESPSLIGSASAEGLRPPLFPQQYTPATTAPLSADPRDRDRDRDRDARMEGVEDPQQHRTTTPRSFKDTVGI